MSDIFTLLSQITLFFNFVILILVVEYLLLPLAVYFSILPSKNRSMLKNLGILMLLLVALSLVFSGFVYWLEYSEIEEAVSMALPEYVDAMRAQSQKFLTPPKFAALLNIPVSIFGAIAFKRGLK